MEQKATTEGTEELGIVSVNHRAGALGNRAGKLGFLVVVGSVIMIGLLMAMNKWNAHRTAEAAKEEQAAKVENRPAQVGPKRVFDSDRLSQPHKSSSALGKGQAHTASLTSRMVVPGVEHSQNQMGQLLPVGTGRDAGRQPGTRRQSRFGGEAILASTHAPTALATQHLQATGPEVAI